MNKLKNVNDNYKNIRLIDIIAFTVVVGLGANDGSIITASAGDMR